MKLVIIAGGKGTRLGLNDIPKPMVHIEGKPLLEYQINLAKRYGINDIFILSGYRADVIIDYFKDGSAFGVSITHVVEKTPLGTAGAVKQLENKICDRFMVFYGDVVFEIDCKSFMEFDRDAPSIASVIVHPNDHPYDSDLLDVDDKDVVTSFYPKPHTDNEFRRNLVNAAIYILSREIFKYIPDGKETDFGRDIFSLALKSGEKIRAYNTAEYIKDIGTVERLKKVSHDLISGKVERRSKKFKRPAIFIDRDGTLVKEIDLLHKVEYLELFPFSAAAVKKINDSDFLCFLVTNQPVVARNLCDISMVKHIHNKLEMLLGWEKAYLNDISFCPHHPDSGYPGENPDFKIDCECRKPKTGMIDELVKKYNVDILSSWLIGDTTTDILTGINAGLKTVLVRTGKGGKDKKFDVSPHFVLDNLEDAVDYILCGTNRFRNVSKEIVSKIVANNGKLPYILSIGGAARSGKSIFAGWLRGYLMDNGISCAVIDLDNWLVGVEQRTDSMTVRNRYKYVDIEKDIDVLLRGGNIFLNLYDPYSRVIKGSRDFSLKNEKCIILVGVPALDIEGLRKRSDLRIYFEVDESKRKERFFSYYRWKDLHKEQIMSIYKKRLDDEFLIVKNSRVYADIVISG